jgi:hypothetical protein
MNLAASVASWAARRRGRRIAGGDLPDLADPFEIADEKVSRPTRWPGSFASTCRVRPWRARQSVRRVRAVSSPTVRAAWCSSTVSRARRVDRPTRRSSRCTVLGATRACQIRAR